MEFQALVSCNPPSFGTRDDASQETLVTAKPQSYPRAAKLELIFLTATCFFYKIEASLQWTKIVK